MATRIIEYHFRDKHVPFVDGASVVAQTPISANATPASSAAFNDATNVVCVQSDEAVYVKFGEAPSATTSDYRLQAGGEQFFHVVKAGQQKVSVRT